MVLSYVINVLLIKNKILFDICMYCVLIIVDEWWNIFLGGIFRKFFGANYIFLKNLCQKIIYL